MSLAQHLWDINADLAARIRTHDFVQGLGNGSLPIDNFKRYVAQDAYFLDAFARGYAFCLANGTSREDLYGFAELISGVVEELKLHKSYTERLQIDLSGVTPTIAAMTPCMRLYAWLGQSLARTAVAPTYADWVKTYSDPGFEALAVRLEALLDVHASDTPAIRANYRRAMELEYGFFAANL